MPQLRFRNLIAAKKRRAGLRILISATDFANAGGVGTYLFFCHRWAGSFSFSASVPSNQSTPIAHSLGGGARFTAAL